MLTPTQTSILGALYWCCVHSAVLEVVNRLDPTSSSAISVGQTLLVVAYTYYKLHSVKTEEPSKEEEEEDERVVGQTDNGEPFSMLNTKVPLYIYAILGTLFAISSLLNNAAYTHNISVPLHTIAKSAGLPITLLVGFIAFGYKYAFHKIFAVIIIFIGTCLFTLYDKDKIYAKTCTSCTEGSLDFLLHEWETGISQILLALLVSAFAGNIQQRAFNQHKPHPVEPVFMTNLMSLPVALTAIPIMKTSIVQWWHAPQLEVSPWWIIALALNPNLSGSFRIFAVPIASALLFSIPIFKIPAILMLGLAVLSQTMCILQVYDVATKSSALTTATVNTIRKFLSMMISTLCFYHVFGDMQWVGIVLVSVGALIFSISQTRGLLAPWVR